MAKIEINAEFKKALDLIENSIHHVFITGRAGTGKSTLLKYFRDKTDKKIAVLAPTGVAAVNVIGETIHSFFGFKPNITVEEAIKLGQKAQKRKIYKKLDLIVIDEVSMVRADLMDCVNIFLQNALQNNNAFGSIKMIFIGDLYQLPPVVTSEERNIFKSFYDSPYFFSSKIIQNLQSTSSKQKLEFIELDKIYRQKDEKFINLLNVIRNKTIEDEHLKILNKRVRENTEKYGNEYIVLTSVNKQAQEINEINLDKLPSKLYIYEGEADGDFKEKDFPTELNLRLKVGARVMLLNNDQAGNWINGTLATVIETKEDSVTIQLDNGEIHEVSNHTWDIYKTIYDEKKHKITMDIVGSFTQLPLKLAWALTIHKSQGKTFDKVIVDFGKGTFASGQAYVALSRCTSLTGLVLKQALKKTHVLLDYSIIKFLTKFQYQISKEKLSTENKIELIKKAIKEKKNLEIIYLKGLDIKSKRKIKPLKVGEMDYNGFDFLGLSAFCLERQQNRVFNVEKILEIEVK
ncbi:AAA family ATPase [Candidatus Peregrinibacteria bacterium RIFOXYB2_FULL_32_7]|nr:MAG: AAA family ATPase [Candidatus Peregrinibacteria bacterium RIFOXYB2_FULL_32_7]